MSDIELPTTNETDKWAGIPLEEIRVGFGRRLGAWLLDYLIVGSISLLIAVVISNSESVNNFIQPLLKEVQQTQEQFSIGSQNRADLEIIGVVTQIIVVVTVVVTLLNFLVSLMEIFIAASPGKLILGIQFATSDGMRAGLKALSIRWAIKHCSTIYVLLLWSVGVFSSGWIGALLSFFTFVSCLIVLGSEKLALHDRFSGTAVFFKEDISG